MAQRTLGLRIPGPSASLALVLSILCALLLSGSLPAASAKHSPKKSSPEAAPAPAPGAAPAAEPPAATQPAVKAPKRRGQGRGPNAAAGPGGGQAAAPGEAPETATTGTGHSAKSGATRTRVAEKRSRRAAEKAIQKTTSEGDVTSPAAAGKSQAQAGKSKHEREREREQRRRERKAEKEGPKETKKEREAREARESEEAARRPVPAAVAASAAPASAPAITGPPAQAATSPLPKIISERPARSSGARRAARSGKGSGHGLPAAAGALAAGAGAAPAASPATTGTSHHHAAARRAAKASGPGSQLVKTVTRIIGVVPPLLWLLVGVLGLLAVAFAVSSRLTVRRARVLARQRQALLEDVGLMQAALLPELPERLGPVGTTAAYRPASGPAAGGDFYDVFALQDGQVAVIVGDVSGHGREALPHTTLLRFTLRAYMEAGLAPREALRAAAPVLERQLGGSFATVVLAVYNPRERTLTYSCAGHPHPLLTGLSAEAPITACSAPPIGADRTTGTRQTVISVPGATVVCLNTDGVIEARVHDELFGVERLSDSLGTIAQTATAASLLDRVSGEADRRSDDMAACILRIEGGSEPPAIRIEELELDHAELGQRRVHRFLAAAGLHESEIERTINSARETAGAHGSALLKLRLGEGAPEITVTHDNVAPLRARAIARTQEVAL